MKSCSQYSCSNIIFKCDQCDYNHTTEKGLGMHKRMKHRISQVDGINDYVIEDFEEDDINMVSIAVKISVKEKKTVKEVEKDLWDTELKGWDKISGFDVEEEMGNFIVTVSCIRRDNPEEFTVPKAVSLLKSLPWPQDYSVIQRSSFS